MHRGVMALVTLAVAAPAFAGDPCVMATKKKDPFEGTEILTIAGPDYAIRMENGAAAIDLTIAEGGVQDQMLPAGFVLHWVLADGSKIDLATTSDTPAQPQAFASQYSASVVTGWSLTFPLSAETVRAVSASAPTHARYTVTEERTRAYTKKWSKLAQRDFTCLATHLAGG
jgi:hypothetical protein